MLSIVFTISLAVHFEDDLDKLRGTWLTVSQISNGKVIVDEKTPVPTGPVTKLVYDGNAWTVKAGDKKFAKGTFKIEAAKSPKEIVIMDDQGKVKLQGIYELNGDTYRYCIAPPGKDKPNEFSSKEGSGHILMILKREKQ